MLICEFVQIHALWLVRKDGTFAQIKARTGLYADAGYLYKIFTGQRSAPKIVQAIREILGLSESA